MTQDRPITAIQQDIINRFPQPVYISGQEAMAWNSYLLSARSDLVKVTAERDALKNKLAEQTKDYAEWMSPEDYVPLTAENERLLERVAGLEEAIRYAVNLVPELGTVPGIATVLAAAQGEGE